MKFFLFLIFPFFVFKAQAVDILVSGKHREVLLQKTITVDLSQSLGLISINVFNASKAPFEGSEGGVSSLYNLGNDIEVISNTEMKAYGWCYTVNGFEPSLMADQFFLTSQNDKVHWFYAYAYYKDGAWISYCTQDAAQTTDLAQP